MDHKLQFLWNDAIWSGCQPDRSEQSQSGFLWLFVLRSEKKEVRKQLVSADQQAVSGQSPAEMRNSDVLSDQMSTQIDSFVDLVQMHLCLGRAFNSIKEWVPHVSLKSNEMQQETD